MCPPPEPAGRPALDLELSHDKEVTMNPDSPDVLGREEGGTDEFGTEAGGTDVLGGEEGGTDEFGTEAGGTDVLGSEEGGTDVFGHE
jgi:hypothetical protein